MMASAGCCCSDVVIYLQAYFVTIATILGTGILGLPVTLRDSGLYPFLISFIFDALLQSLLVHLFLDLLQKAYAAQYLQQREESVPLNTVLEEDIDLDSDDDDDDQDTSNGAIMKGRMLHIREVPLVQPPNLHLLGKLFLTCGLQQSFDVLVILQFIALLICYALAGSEALAHLFGINHVYIIPVFVWVLTAAIVLALQLIQPIVSVLTFLKGSLLLATRVEDKRGLLRCQNTLVTFYVGMAVAQEIKTDFSYFGAPFLMGSVALGGVCNTMPYTFEKVPYRKGPIAKYRLAVQLGLWTCVLLNILWCWSVLEIVPQTIDMACSSMTRWDHCLYTNAAGQVFGVVSCKGELSLESAAVNGEISTLPLSRVLEKDYPSFLWVAQLVNTFIMVSISVSYLTIGTALHHTLSGIVHTFLMKKQGLHSGRLIKANKKSFSRWFAVSGVSLAAFSLVFTVAMLDPQGFVSILEKLVSFSLNAEVGLYFFLMLVWSRRGRYQNLEIPLPVSPCIFHLIYLLPVFFNFAVFYDIYISVLDWMQPPQHHAVLINSSLVEGNHSFSDCGGDLVSSWQLNTTTALAGGSFVTSLPNSLSTISLQSNGNSKLDLLNASLTSDSGNSTQEMLNI